MKRCKRCNQEIKAKQTHCTSCGLKLGLNNTYYSSNSINNGSKQNYRNISYKSQKKNPAIGCFVSIFLIFYVISFIFGIGKAIIEDIVEESYEEVEYTYEVSVDEIEELLYNTKLIIEDYYKVWTYANKQELTLEDITEYTSLKMEDLTNISCKNLEKKYSIEDAIFCVNYAHNDIGTYSSAHDDLTKLYSIVIQNDLTQIEYDILVDIYNYGIDLYYITYDYTNYAIFEVKYKEYINKLDSLIEELSNITT